MIGGTDIVLTGKTSVHDANLLVCVLRDRWPDLVVQAADDAAPLPRGTSLNATPEFFVYRRRADFDSWAAAGAAAENADSMIHVIVESDALTLVAAPGESARIAQRAIELIRTSDQTIRRRRPGSAPIERTTVALLFVFAVGGILAVYFIGGLLAP